ncbi:MAG: hypothetical protein V5A55_09690 [Halovenus sp.]
MKATEYLSHPAFGTATGMFVAYGIILLVMFTLLFLVPFVFFSTF